MIFFRYQFLESFVLRDWEVAACCFLPLPPFSTVIIPNRSPAHSTGGGGLVLGVCFLTARWAKQAHVTGLADDALRGLCVVPLLLPGSPVAIKLNADCWEGGGKGKAFWKSATIML